MAPMKKFYSVFYRIHGLLKKKKKKETQISI